MMSNNRPGPLPEEKYMLLSGYVLGDLTSEEVEQVEQLALDDPAVLKELHSLEASFELLPQGLTQISPPASLRERFFVPSKSLETAPVLPQGSKGVIWKILVGLAAIATLALATDNLRLRQQLAQQLEEDRVAAILQQPNSRLIALTGNGTNAAGTLLFTPGNWQEVIVSLGDLPPLPPDEVYRMWLALENGTVIYCGEFDTGDDGSIFVRFTPNETPPEGVKTTELFVTIDGRQTDPDPSGVRVMTGAI
ncbi:anti-sigma factor [Leptothoe sp. EHU-05/26/07-4]